MHYYAKLALGRFYKVHGKIFEKGVEHEVNKETYDYLKTCGERQLSAEGNRFIAVLIPRFHLREVEDTIEEVVTQEIEDAPDTLRPNKKPGPKPRAE